MTRLHCSYSVRSVVLMLAFSASSLLADTIRYSITNLGTLGGASSIGASGINNGGQVVGSSPTPSGFYHAFLWQSGSGMQDLGTLGGFFSNASGINNSGQVVGGSDTPPGGQYRQDHAFLWQSGTGMQDLGTLGGSESGASINESSASAINDSGQVVGSSSTPSGFPHAFLWQSGSGMQNLGTLGGSESYANAINNSGQVVGSSSTPSGGLHAFLWQSGTGMRDLGTLGASFSEAYSINNSGQVVGDSARPGTYRLAFLYSDGQMFDLNTLVPANSGWVLETASDINDAGQIVGIGSYQGQFGRAFLLTPETPVPEPANAALCSLVVLVGLVLLRRRP